MLESLVAIALLTVVLGLAATVGSTMLKHRKHIQQHRITLEAKANLLTFAMAWPYERLSEDILQKFADELTASDDKASWEIRIEDADMAKKISVDLAYGQATAALRKPLVCWRYPVGLPAKSEDQP